MGVDLKLLVCRDRAIRPESHCPTMLDLDRDGQFWAEFERIPGQDTPGPIKSYVATGWGILTVDPYGNRLRYARAMDLAVVLESYIQRSDWDEDSIVKTRAAAAYLDSLPLDWPVVLYWY
jgi:hypothetical protein